MFDVITVGSATVDAFAQTSTLSLIKAKKLASELICYPSGGKILIDRLTYTVGGGGTNTAVSLSKLGLKVAYMGKIGKGANSKFVLEVLRENNINTSLVAREKARTGFSVILDAEGIDRTILTYKGSNNDLRESDIKFKMLKTKWFYFSSMMETSFETQKRIAKYAEKHNIDIAYNPSSYLCKKGAKNIHDILKRTTLLILNTEEAALLVGKSEIPKMLKNLCALGPKHAIITHGKKGASCYYDDKMYDVFAQKVKMVETTGAGDAFASTFLGVIIKKNDPILALKMATLNAQSVIRNIGAKTGLLSWQKLNNLAQTHSPKVVDLK
jgi:ribokinase